MSCASDLQNVIITTCQKNFLCVTMFRIQRNDDEIVSRAAPRSLHCRMCIKNNETANETLLILTKKAFLICRCRALCNLCEWLQNGVVPTCKTSAGTSFLVNGFYIRCVSDLCECLAECSPGWSCTIYLQNVRQAELYKRLARVTCRKFSRWSYESELFGWLVECSFVTIYYTWYMWLSRVTWRTLSR